MLVIHRLAQVTHNPVIEGASPIGIMRKRSHKDCRNRVVRVDKSSEEFESGHGRHLDVGDQAACFGEARGGEKFSRRRERVGRIAKRPQQPAHGLTTEPIIIDDRHQDLFHRSAYGHSLDPSCGQPTMPTFGMELLDAGENATSAAPVPHKLWLSLTTIAKLSRHGF
jgi:hypothetical protein